MLPASGSRFHTILDMLRAAPDAAIALRASDSTATTYAQLVDQIELNRARLAEFGLGPHSRIAIVMPNGAAMAGTFLSIAASATACPLNAGYRAEEFEFYLNDLNAAALVLEAGSTSSAREVAAKLHLPIIEAHQSEHAGLVSFSGPASAASAASLPAEVTPAAIALILHTSGTTSRPKLVPLSQANVTASACNVRDSVALVPGDVGLLIMPLFHIHGLIAGLLAPLAAGSTIFVSSGFNALKFFAWMKEAEATWYTAVPTMHQTILARASHHRDVIAQHPLRFMRSSSSSMAPQIIRELEEVFAAPLIEAYGMTEAAHQMASNPLPPAVRKPGTVGRAAGPEVAIMNAEGELLGTGETGEIVIRGVNVTHGYENNDKANAEAFTAGWFRTGDQGHIDGEGYITITGRLKEIINRGGEKISPREIDEILLEHPAVAQAVTFAVPHDKLGEDIACAVVLKNDSPLSEKELRAFVAGRVADFKVPRKILLLDDIPKGPTGKLQRIGLAKTLGLA